VPELLRRWLSFGKVVSDMTLLVVSGESILILAGVSFCLVSGMATLRLSRGSEFLDISLFANGGNDGIGEIG